MSDPHRGLRRRGGGQRDLAIEQRLRDRGLANLPELPRLGGARILAAVGELAVKAQAFDAIARLVRQRS